VSAEAAVLPYCKIVGQEDLRRALEIDFVSPGVGGVLVAGNRGTAKSTTVRSFARMATGRLPVTLPIGATDDRVLGGWRVEALMASEPEWQPGLIEEAGGGPEPGILYIDEVNLLDDHLTNIILDVASTGILVVQREGAARGSSEMRFSLVGTMNPEEGSLRPQLLDRFGLVVLVRSGTPEERMKVLKTVLEFEEYAGDPESKYQQDGYRRDRGQRTQLRSARNALHKVQIPDGMFALAARIAAEFKVEGHRGELAMLRAARALAAIEKAPAVTAGHLAEVAPLALVHRRAASDSGTVLDWSAEDTFQLEVLTGTGLAEA
jgi:magnesium chelatase subunit I